MKVDIRLSRSITYHAGKSTSCRCDWCYWCMVRKKFLIIQTCDEFWTRVAVGFIFSPSAINTSLRCGIALNTRSSWLPNCCFWSSNWTCFCCGLELPNSGPDVMIWTLHAVLVDGLGLALRSVSSRSSPSLDFCLPSAGSDVAIICVQSYGTGMQRSASAAVGVTKT